MLDFQAARWLIAKEVPGQAGNNHPTCIPTGVFRTSDGHINIAAAGNDIYRRLCKALAAPHLATDPEFAGNKGRYQNRDKLNAVIEEITVQRTSAQWIEVLNQAGVPCGPINNIDEVFADPQAKYSGIAQPVDHPLLRRIELVGQAVTLSGTPSQIRIPTPEAGQYTDTVLRELGYDEAAITALRSKGVV